MYLRDLVEAVDGNCLIDVFQIGTDEQLTYFDSCDVENIYIDCCVLEINSKIEDGKAVIVVYIDKAEIE